MEQGFSSMLGGIYDGVSGVVMQPIKGAKDSGAQGFFKGVGKGLTGLFVKPVSGFLDTISKTAEGVKNTVKNEDLHQIRSRRIRPFYGFEQELREYADDDAIF